MKHIILTLLIFVLIMMSGSYFGHAANHYVLDGGSGDGSDWDNAWDSLPAALTRGDTYYIGDGNYAAHRFNDAESSTTLITIKKATVADHGTETGWDNAYGDGQAVFAEAYNAINFTTGYYLFDGRSATTQSDSTTYGFLIVSDDSTSISRMVGLPGQGYSSYQIDHVTIQYTAVVAPGSVYNVNQNPIYSYATADKLPTDLNISHCYIGNGVANMLICGWKDSYIQNCYFSGNWSSESYHGEQISTSVATDSPVAHLTLRNNVFNNSQVYALGMHKGGNDTLYIYNNVFIGGTGTALIGTADSGTPNIIAGLQVHHNTCINTAFNHFLMPGNIAAGDTSFAYNNLFIGCATPRMTNAGYTAGAVVYDYNAYYGCSGTYTPSANAVYPAQDPTNGGTPDYDLAYAVPVLDQVTLDAIAGITISVDIEDTTRDAIPDAGAYELESGGEAPSDVTVWTAIADSGGTGGANDIAYIIANADTADVVILGDGEFKAGDLAFQDTDISMLVSGDANAVLSNKKTITSFTELAGAGTPTTDTVKIAANGDDLHWNTDTRTINNISASYVLTGEYATGVWYTGYLRFALSNSVIDYADSMKLRLYSTTATTTNAPLTVSMQGTAQATAPTDTTGFLAAMAETLSTGGITYAAQDWVISTWHTFNISRYADSLKAEVDYSTTNYLALFLTQNGDLSNRFGRWDAKDHATNNEAMIVVWYTPPGTGDNSYKVLTGEETNPSYCWFNGTLGTKVSYKDSLGLNEWCESGDSLYVPTAQDDDVIEIDGYDTLIDFNGNANITINGSSGTLEIRAFGATGVLADAVGTIQYALFDTSRVSINATATQTLDHITIDGEAIAADTLIIVDSAITNSIVETVVVVDTTGGYAGSYNNWNASGDQPEGTGDTTFDLQLGTNGIPDSLIWDTRPSGTPKQYYGYAYYPIGTLEITSPNGGETYIAGTDSIIITWDSDLIGNIIISYSDSGYSSPIDTVNATLGTITIFSLIDSTEQAKYILTSIDDPLVTDESDDYFTYIVSSITILIPNGGETYEIGQTLPITWTYSANIDSVKIEYSLNNGTTWTTITEATESDGEYEWIINSSVSTEAIIRITKTP